MVKGLALFSATAAHGAPTAETTFGKLIGVERASPGCAQFMGVPYAKAPIGDLRFEAPVPWDEQYPSGGLGATTAGDMCAQVAGGAEDCLFLNVWQSASNDATELLPVMAWVHGGSFVSGAGSDYDGCQLAAQHGVVIASMNYRMGPFGYALFGDGLGANFGMKDQRESFAWLQREARAFGGDGQKITIFGESAGGISIFHHVASPASRGFFRAAISESGFPSAWGYEYGQNITNAFAAKLNCTDSSAMRACLRSKSATDMVDQAGEAGNPLAQPGWSPSVDNSEEMPAYPFKMFFDGRTNPVPFMAGSNTNEGVLFTYPFFPLGMNTKQYEDFIHTLLDSHDPVAFLTDDEFATLFKKYPDNFVGDKRPVAADLATDGTFRCGTTIPAQVYSTGDLFNYRFNRRPAGLKLVEPILPGVFHGLDVEFVFGNEELNAEEQELSQRMQVFWTNFAKHLDPSQGNRTAFPKYSNDDRKSIVFQVPEDVFEEDFRGDYCDLMNELVFQKYVNAPSSVLV